MSRAETTVLLMLAVATSLSAPGCSRKPTPLDEVTLRLNWAPSAEHAFIYLGKDKGFFQRRKLDLHILPGEGSTVVAQLVGNGTNDFGLISGDILVMAKLKGVPLTAVAVLYHESPATIYSLKEKGITLPKQLEGRRLGVLIKSTTYQQYQGVLRNAGVRRDRIIEVPVSGNVQELLSGPVDAAMHYTNYLPVQIRYLGRQVNEILMKDYGIRIYSQSIVANDAYIARNRALTQRFVDAMLESLEYSEPHVAEALASLLRHNPELGGALQEQMLKRTNQLLFSARPPGFGIGYMTTEGWEQTQDTLLAVGLIDKRMAAGSFCDNGFWQAYRASRRKP